LFELKNGVRGVLVDLPHLNSVTVEVYLKIGSKYEMRNEFGISHVLEHMAFKGTKKRKTAIGINVEINSKGAIYNAGTGYEATSYYITTVKRNIHWAVEFLSDILMNSTFPEIELKKELGVVAEEIKMYEDNPTMGLAYDFVEFMYGESKRGCWSISGSVKDVSVITRKKMINYRSKYLSGENMVVVVAGKLGNKKEIKKQTIDCFGGFNRQSSGKTETEIVLGKSRKMIKKKKIDQAHFCFGVPTIERSDKRRYVAVLVETMISGNSSSRLYEQIRQKSGLAYYVFSLGQLLTETGYTGVQAGVNNKKLDFALELTRNEYVDFYKTVKEEELKRIKDFILGKSEMSLDKTSFWSDFVGQRLLLDNKVVSLESELEKFKKVGLKEVKEFAKEFFRKDAFRLVVAKS
ncbi:insulinase family protein, partial [Patescibacteria group bacterium]|nr:insulinase family protein [Patescibacteria group bacterium]